MSTGQDSENMPGNGQRGQQRRCAPLLRPQREGRGDWDTRQGLKNKEENFLSFPSAAINSLEFTLALYIITPVIHSFLRL